MDGRSAPRYSRIHSCHALVGRGPASSRLEPRWKRAAAESRGLIVRWSPRSLSHEPEPAEISSTGAMYNPGDQASRPSVRPSARHFLRGSPVSPRCLPVHARGSGSSCVLGRLSLVCERHDKRSRLNGRARSFRQLRDEVLPLCRAAETDNNPERCSLSGCADRPPTNQRAEAAGPFPPVGQSALIEGCYHRDARRPSV